MDAPSETEVPNPVFVTFASTVTFEEGEDSYSRWDVSAPNECSIGIAQTNLPVPYQLLAWLGCVWSVCVCVCVCGGEGGGVGGWDGGLRRSFFRVGCVRGALHLACRAGLASLLSV